MFSTRVEALSNSDRRKPPLQTVRKVVKWWVVDQELEVQLEEYFPNHTWKVPNFLHFGSRIGGDRDGNPNVTPEITWETLKLQRQLVIKKYEKAIVDLMKRFSQSSSRVEISERLIQSVEKEEQMYIEKDEAWPIEAEVYRRKFAVM